MCCAAVYRPTPTCVNLVLCAWCVHTACWTGHKPSEAAPKYRAQSTEREYLQVASPEAAGGAAARQRLEEVPEKLSSLAPMHAHLLSSSLRNVSATAHIYIFAMLHKTSRV